MGRSSTVRCMCLVTLNAFNTPLHTINRDKLGECCRHSYTHTHTHTFTYACTDCGPGALLHREHPAGDSLVQWGRHIHERCQHRERPAALICISRMHMLQG